MEQEEDAQKLYDLSKAIQAEITDVKKVIEKMLKLFTKMGNFFSAQAQAIKKKRPHIKLSSKKKERKKQKEEDEEDNFNEEEEDNNDQEEEMEKDDEEKPQQITHQRGVKLLGRKLKRTDYPQLKGRIMDYIGYNRIGNNKTIFKVVMVINDTKTELGPYETRPLAEELCIKLESKLKASRLNSQSTKEEIMEVFTGIRKKIYAKYPPIIDRMGIVSARKCAETVTKSNNKKGSFSNDEDDSEEIDVKDELINAEYHHDYDEEN